MKQINLNQNYGQDINPDWNKTQVDGERFSVSFEITVETVASNWKGGAQ